MTVMPAMTQGYEALRCQATGDGVPSATPRGLALLLRSGVGAWMAVWQQLAGGAPPTAASAPSVAEETESRDAVLRLGPELAVVLVEMALSGQVGQAGQRDQRRRSAS